MAKTCKICCHPRVREIEAELARNTLRMTASRFDVSVSSLHRHRYHAGALSEACDIANRLKTMIKDLDVISRQARKAHKWSSAVGALREKRECVLLLERFEIPLPASSPPREHHTARELLQKLAFLHRDSRAKLSHCPSLLNLFDRLVAGEEVSDIAWSALGNSVESIDQGDLTPGGPT
jgi:hypothetical protein